MCKILVQNSLYSSFLRKSPPIYSWTSTKVQEISRIIKITIRSLDHLATITSTRTSRRRATVLAPPSLELGKTCRGRACCNRCTGSRRAKAPRTIAREQQPSPMKRLHRLEGTLSKSSEIQYRHTSTCLPATLEASSRRGIDGADLIPSSGSRHHHAFLSRTQNLNIPRKTSKKTEPSRRQGPGQIHRASMSLRPQEVGRLAAPPTGGGKP
jgi:hypothetical protein